jgi:hypothetical protein
MKNKPVFELVVGMFVLPLICLSTGCSRIEVRLNGFTPTGTTLQLPPNSSVVVVEDPNALNPIFEKEIASKIQRLLKSKGYNTSSFENANFYLTFQYGIDSGRTTTGTMPIYHSGETITATTYDSGGGSSFTTINTPGYTTYMPYSRTAYTRGLVLSLIDAKKYQETQKIEPVWISEMVSGGTSSDLRYVINYMLVAAFEHFGENTNKRVREIFLENDERVKLLMGN